MWRVMCRVCVLESVCEWEVTVLCVCAVIRVHIWCVVWRLCGGPRQGGRGKEARPHTTPRVLATEPVSMYCSYAISHHAPTSSAGQWILTCSR